MGWHLGLGLAQLPALGQARHITRLDGLHEVLERVAENSMREMHGFRRMHFLATNLTDKYKITFASTFNINHLKLFPGTENLFWFILQKSWELMVVLYASFSLKHDRGVGRMKCNLTNDT